MTRCRFGHPHQWLTLRDATACGVCGKVSGSDRKVNTREDGWLIRLADER